MNRLQRRLRDDGMAPGVEERLRRLEMTVSYLQEGPRSSSSDVAVAALLRWRFSAQMMVVLIALLEEEIVDTDELVERLYPGDAPRPGEPRQIVKVLISGLRKRLHAEEIRIENVYDTGYFITRESKQRAQDVLLGQGGSRDH